jgi:hypothetical protein
MFVHIECLRRNKTEDWSRSKQRNVYLQGHHFGWPGTGSHLVFYHLKQAG